MKKNLIVLLSVPIFLSLSTSSAFAHVSVKPSEIGVAARTNFVVSVPTEEDDPTVAVRLIIPEGIQSVRPNVKPGWKIELKKSGQGEDSVVKEIIWTGGSIPSEQRDEFVFSAQAPASKTTIVWKAYQTYGDGDIVAWENSPEVVKEYAEKNPPKEGQEDDHNAPRPYSETKVIDDLAKEEKPAVAQNNTKAVAQNNNNSTTWVSYGGLLLGAISLALHLRKR